MEMEHDSLQPAGFGVRLGAQLIDGVIFVSTYLMGYFLFKENTGFDIVYDILALLYTLALPILWNGQTIGKRVLGIRIIKVNGERIGLGTMLIRSLVVGFFYGITLGIALIISLFMVVLRKDKRSIHDLVAGTYVGRD